MSNEKKNSPWYAGRGRKNTNTDPTQVMDAATGKMKKAMHQFPEDLGKHQFHMVFHKYDFAQDLDEAAVSIALPMPGSILDKYGVEYNTADLTTAGGVLAKAINVGRVNLSSGTQTSTPIDPTADNYAEVTKNVFSSIGGIVRDLNPVESVKNASNLALGNIVNPHTSLLFNAVKLKEFEFTWKLYPRQEKETVAIQTIINTVKRLSHPEFGFSQDVTADGINNFHLKYPHEVDLFYVGGHTGLEMHRFKRAAVTNMQVNYTPESGPQFIAGSQHPAFVELTLGFTETQIWTADDFDTLEAFPEKPSTKQTYFI